MVPDATRSIVLITNATSGRAEHSLGQIDDLLRRVGLQVLETIPIKEVDRLRRWTEGDHADRPLIVAAGGDGTIGSVAEYLVGTDFVLGILPAGTSNDVARSLGIPISMKKAVRVLIDGASALVDIGRFDAPEEQPRYFLHAATAGVNVAFARLATRSTFRQRLGKLTYLAAALAALRQVKPFSCDVVIDGERTSLSLLQLCVVNAPVFGGLLHLQLPGSRIDDRRLDVLALDAMPPWGIVITALRVLLGKGKTRRGIRLFQVQEIDVDPGQSLEVTLDGEIAAKIPGRFCLKAEALRVMRPR